MKLYIYDHCPYCVKARMIFGLKGVPVALVTLLNDDEETPTRMIGKKMVPILEKEDGSFMPESMDIVHYVDENYGEKRVGAGGDAGLSDWLAALKSVLSPLVMPRWVAAPLEEFSTAGARAYFTRKKEAAIGPFREHLARSGELIATANARLEELEGMIQGEQAVHGQLSEDDFHLFAALRSLSIVKGIKYPPKVEAYRRAMARAANVPLHDGMAI